MADESNLRLRGAPETNFTTPSFEDVYNITPTVPPACDSFRLCIHGISSSSDDQSINPFLYIYILLVLFGTVTCIFMRERSFRREDRAIREASAPDGQQTPAQGLFQGMSPAQREEYVSKVLKTQKFKATTSDTRKLAHETSSGCDEELAMDTPDRGCAICLEPFCANDTVCRGVECQHVFHHQCAHDWLVKHADCPCCRRPYLMSFDNVEL